VLTEDVPSQPETLFRTTAVASAIGLGALSLFLGLAIAGAILGIPGFSSGPGAFLAASYGLLAFAIPANLAYAAFILMDKEWRPDRVFFLSVSIFPFLTLAAGVSFVRDFEIRSAQFSFLEVAGRTGFTFIIAILTVLELLSITALRILIFPKSRGPGFWVNTHAGNQLNERFTQWLRLRREKAQSQSVRKNAASAARVKAEARPVAAPTKPVTTVVEAPLPLGTPTKSATTSIEASLAADAFLFSGRDSRLREVYAEAAASRPGSSRFDGTPAALRLSETEGSAQGASAPEKTPETAGDAVSTEETEQAGNNREILSYISLKLPEQKPLASLAAAAKKEDPDQAGDQSEAEAETESEAQADSEDDLEELEPLDDEDTAVPTFPVKSSGPQSPQPSSPEILSVKPKPVPKAKLRGAWKVPVDILNQYPDGEYWIIDDATRAAAGTLRETLEEFKIQAEVTGIRKGPVITMFEILPAPGVKLSKIVNLQDNIALRLAASSVRIVAPIPGKHAVGIEVPNAKRNIVSFREIIEGELHRDKKQGKTPEIPVILGKDITGEAQTVDLATTPHLLIAGATGSGKSVCVNAMILSILYQKHPTECRLILIDPKIVELKLYNDIPHLLTPVITEPKKAFQALQYCIFEMERRYACLDSMGVRDIKSYNKRIKERNIAAEHMPYIVVVIDEFADLMATTGKELESTVARLAAMSRAVGIHLVLATQRPSIDVITGLITANIPSRIAFMVASKMDSRIIIDQVGAEKLLGKGDMLYSGIVDPFPVRMQGAFVSEEEVERVVEHVKTLGEPDYIDDEIFYDED
jgi:DNA segregation ATPase FtsK/SpoIIIE-like protein